MTCFHCFLSAAISSVMFNFSMMSSSTTLLQVFFDLSIGFLPSTSSSIALLSMLFSSLHFTWPNHLNLVFLNLCSRFSAPHVLLTSSLVILSCHLHLTCISTFYDHNMSTMSMVNKFFWLHLISCIDLESQTKIAKTFSINIKLLI